MYGEAIETVYILKVDIGCGYWLALDCEWLCSSQLVVINEPWQTGLARDPLPVANTKIYFKILYHTLRGVYV